MKLKLPILAILLLAACAAPGTRDENPPLSPAEIAEMAKKGENAANIIAAIQKSHTTYHLTASQFVQLSKEGVPDAVLDFMQQTHLRDIERIAQRAAFSDLWWSTHPWYGHPWYSQPQIIYIPVRPAPTGK